MHVRTYVHAHVFARVGAHIHTHVHRRSVASSARRNTVNVAAKVPLFGMSIRMTRCVSTQIFINIYKKKDFINISIHMPIHICINISVHMSMHMSMGMSFTHVHT